MGMGRYSTAFTITSTGSGSATVGLYLETEQVITLGALHDTEVPHIYKGPLDNIVLS